MPRISQCPSCLSEGLEVFYEVARIPIHSCIMSHTQDKARSFPLRDLALGFCGNCGFITNTLFDSSVQDYNPEYEDQQSFSPTFNKFAKELAVRLIDKHGLRGKTVVEIGCGKGDFLALICKEGGNRGIGIDPTIIPERQSDSAGSITWVRDFYSEKYGHYQGDMICCRHTLEHIHPVRKFVETIRRSIGDKGNTAVVFELPSATRVIRDLAYEDIYYEHCSYFSPGSLARLFRASGFEVTDISLEYDNQYLVLEALPVPAPSAKIHPLEESVEQMRADTRRFAVACREKLDGWKARLAGWKSDGKRVIAWGSGSKAVAFLTTLGVRDELQYVVDINPHRWGKFMPGVAKEVKAPDFLREFQPDVVIVMNAIYIPEIKQMTAGMGISPQFLAA